MSYFDSEEYKKKENYYLEKIKKSTTYSAFLKEDFEDLEWGVCQKYSNNVCS